jgi:hypothetical protein
LASFGLCVIGGEKWTLEKAFNYILKEYASHGETKPIEIDEIHRPTHGRRHEFFALGELLGLSLKTVFNSYRKVYGTGGDTLRHIVFTSPQGHHGHSRGGVFVWVSK